MIAIKSLTNVPVPCKQQLSRLQVAPANAGLYTLKCKPFVAHKQAVKPVSRRAFTCNASTLQVTESATGIQFPLVQEFWQGETYRSMGAGARTKKIAIISVKVYAITLYVEAEKAARELGIRKRGGFFDDDKDEDFTLALVDGGFDKVLQLQLARDVTGQQFVEAIATALEPRMRLMGQMAELEQFKVYFMNKQLSKGTNVTLMFKSGETLDALVTPQAESSYAMATPELSIKSAGLCRALLEVFMGSESVVPDAKTAWAKGARELLDSEEIRRSSRKTGS